MKREKVGEKEIGREKERERHTQRELMFLGKGTEAV